MKDILERLAHSSANEGSHDLQCRCFDAAEEISRLRIQRVELVSALSKYVDHFGDPLQCANAAIAKAKAP